MPSPKNIEIVALDSKQQARQIIHEIDAQRLELEAEAKRTTDQRKRTRLLARATRYARAIADGYEYLITHKKK